MNFPDYNGDLSDKQWKRFHQDIKTMKSATRNGGTKELWLITAIVSEGT